MVSFVIVGGHGGGQHQQQQRAGRPRGPHLGYRKLKELQSTEPSEMAVSLLQYRESFEMLVNAEEIKEDWMTLLVEILGKMCHTQMIQNLIDVMSICKGSALMRTHLPKYILNLPMIQEEMESESQFSVLVECLITFFKEWLVRFPRSFTSEIPIDHFGGILKEVNVKGVEEFRKEVETLLAKRRELIGEERKMTQAPKKPKRPEVEPPPPDDFKEISIYPSEKEICSEEKPFLRRNKTEETEKYKDLNDYLDVQFRLLREDFVAPLREGIREIIKKIPKEDRSQNLYIYENVEVMNTVFTRAGIVHRIHLDMRGLRRIPWEHSKRLLFGSFLCLSKDNFKTMLFATVANRKPEDLRLGRLDIRFVEGLEATRGKYVMVESPAYFEAYRPILLQLKQITPDTFPFQEYLVHCNSEVKPPQYLRSKKSRRSQVQYDLGETLGIPDAEDAKKVSIFDSHAWPHVDDVNLNESQLESLKGALTKEFSVIQGPPGTGISQIH